MKSTFKIGSVWLFEVFRDGKKIKEKTAHNIVTDAGLNALLDIMFHGSTQITTWYVAPHTNNYSVTGSETYAVPGYTEWNAGYDEATRPAYVEAAASAQSITNSANKASFTSNGTVTIYGAALVGGGTDPTVKANTAGGGTLFNVVAFTGGGIALESADVLKVTVTISAADDGV